MPHFPIVDTHLHLWDLDKLQYPWLNDVPPLKRSFLLEEYAAACGPLEVQQMVFMQADCLPEQALDEARWVATLMQAEPRLAGMVAFAPLEKGQAARQEIDQLRAANPHIKGIRRLLQGAPGLDFCLQPDFIEGVSLLAAYDLPFDLCLNYRHLPYALEFAKQVPQVKIVIDHIAKPDIKGGEFKQWAQGIAELAKLEHVHCKLSSLATEADHDSWQADTLRPYVDHVLTQFGPEKCFFASDWPVCTLAASLTSSVETLVKLLADFGLDAQQQQVIFSENGRAFYGL